MSIKVAIYEDNEPLRKSLSHLIMGTESMEFCGAWPDCSSILENCSNLTPDVIVMDIDMPGITGIEATVLISMSLFLLSLKTAIKCSTPCARAQQDTC